MELDLQKVGGGKRATLIAEQGNNPMSEPLVIYHANCQDGFCAAWLFGKAFPDAEFHAAHYGTEPPAAAMDKDRPLYLVDFSYSRDVMFRLAALRREEMVVLDHHKTAQQALEGLEIELSSNNCGDALTVKFDLGKSGGRLAWEHLYGSQRLPDDWLTTSRSGYSLGVAPWLVDYTEDRDLWRWELPESQEVNACLRSYPLDFGLWDTLRLRKPHDLAIEGTAILRREKQIVDDHLRHAREVEIAGHRVLCVNATVLFSEIAGELAKGRPFGACYFDRADGKRQYSLRSEESGVDVSAVAREYGGGGHPHAAGYETNP